ncbi:RHS repeat-associated core domain-containing protein [Streptomyces sp. NPDC088910]|uniref:RHS repeat-associated core domain-containing protein n=1 Tax=Streptomyces sp. NPDC088910 TaxID=3365911 RepID=UPI00380C8333
MRITPVFRRRTPGRIAAVMSGALVATLLQAMPSALAEATADSGRPAVRSLEKTVKGTNAKVRPRQADRTVSKPRTPKNAWPTGGTASVALSAPTSASAKSTRKEPGSAPSVNHAVRAGSLPVSLTPMRSATDSASRATVATAPAPGAATVRVLDHSAAKKAGVDGVLLTVTGSGAQDSRASLSLDYSAFADAAGAGYGERLRLVQFPECVLTTPKKAECRNATELAGRNDAEHHIVTADAVPVPATATDTATAPLPTTRSNSASGMTVLAATASASGPSGDYTSSPLSSASTWSTALNSGSFSWSYDMPAPTVPGGLVPSVGLSYSSGAIDGRTANANNQGSWVGDGFDIAPGFVERSYKPCRDDGVKTDGVEPGDECWAYDNATISFEGHSGELIPISTDEWRIKGDDGTKVVRLRSTARGNGDNDGEYFEAITTNGTQYYFGYNRLPNWTSGKPETKSVETLPVFGDDAGEPCHASTFASSWCQQGWRWNLDLVIDTSGNDITYWYNPETNSYGRNLKPTDGTPYARAATLDHIEYGQQQSDIYSATVKPMAKVNFATAERCLEATASLCDPASIDANRQYWYDTPWDMNCKAGTTCDQGRFSPTFWTRTRLTKVTTQTLQTDGGYKDIDTWSLHHKWGTADADYQLLLDSITHTAVAGATPVALPPTTLGYDPRIGRLDKTGDGRSPFYKQRLSTIDDEAGGQIDVNYSQPACDWDHLLTPQSNTTHCFPQMYQASDKTPVTTEWFNKYVVDAVIGTDRTGGAPDMVTHYTYIDGGAWAFDDDEGLTKEKLKTWSQWRGHAHVRVETGGTSGMSSQVDHYFLRGMDGDRSDQSDATKTRTVQVSDGEGATLTDDEAWAGFEYRTETFDKPGGKILAKTVNTPWKKETAKRVRDWGTTTANLTGISVARGLRSLDNGAGGQWAQTRSDTTFDGYGRATVVEALGDVGVAGDDQCTRTTYADNTAAWILTGAIRTETVAGTCAATPNRDTQPDGTSAVISDTRTRYDGQAYGAAPTKGRATLTEKLKVRNGGTATYLDDAATYDVYGRQLTATALASMSVFDTTGVKATVTTPVANARVTTTAYTPATGRPVRTIVTTPPATVGVPTSAQTTTTYTDSLRGLPLISIDTTARRTDVLYDALGRLLKVWQPNRSKADGQTPNTEYAYANVDGAIASVTTKTLNNDGSQDAAYTLYDGFGRVRQVQAPGQNGGRLLTDTFYDERGQAAIAYAPYYATGTPSANLFKVEDATGVETQTATRYDGLGRVVKTTILAGNGVGTPLSTTTTSYGGNSVTVTPPKGGTPTTTITDAAGHTVELRQYKAATPTGAYDSTAYGYDNGGNLNKITDPSHNVWTWTYDQLGRQVKAVDPDSGTTTKAYNDRGELVSVTDGRTKTVAHVYDNLSREIETRDGSATGQLLTSQTWDPAGSQGQLASTTRYVPINGTTYQYKTVVNTYDALYHATKSTLTVPSVPGQEGLAGSYVTGGNYNLDGTVQSAAYPAVGSLAAENVAYTYNKEHLAATISSNLSGYLSAQTYSVTGKPMQSALNAGGKTTWVTNAYEWGTQRLSGSRTDQQDITGAARATAYTYDEAGDVTSLSDKSRTGTDQQCFQYDYLARLTEAFTPTDATCPATPDATKLGGPAPYWSSYTYNTDGTRKTETRHDPSGIAAADAVSTYAYPTSGPRPHSLTQSSTVVGDGTPVVQSYGYDDAGNTTNRHVVPDSTRTDDQSLAWGTEDHLDKVTDTVRTTSGSTTVTTTKTTDYVYDTSGNRLIEHTLDTASPSAENTTLYLGSTEVNFVKGAAKATATRYYPLGSAVAVRTNDNKVTLQVTDAHGTADANIDAVTGALTQHYETPFGGDRGPSPTSWAGTKGFLGGTKDLATGLTHLGARDYDPSTGRFISVDPLLAPQDPQSLTGYTYSSNNPLTLSDPSGERPLGACDGTCGGGTTEAWSGGPGDWQYTFVSKPEKKNKVTVQHVDFRDTNKSWVKAVKVKPPVKQGDMVDWGWGVMTGVTKVTSWIGTHTDPICWFSDCGNAGDSLQKFAGNHGADTNSIYFNLGKNKGIEVSVLAITEGIGRLAARDPEGFAAGCYNSFPAGTKVLLADGSAKSIDKLTTSDKVAAADPRTGDSGPRNVDATLITPDDTDFTTLTLAGAVATLTATDHHPFWSPSRHAWLDAGDLKPGMTVRSADGKTIRILATEHFHKLQAAYNLTVRDLHTYYVLAGSTPVLVHNCNGTIDPSLVRFSQDTVSPRFGSGETIEQTAAGLRSGYIKPEDLPTVRLQYKDGNLFSLDNRRLVAFQKAGIQMPFRMATPEEIAGEAWKFTTKNDGASILIQHFDPVEWP